MTFRTSLFTLSRQASRGRPRRLRPRVVSVLFLVLAIGSGPAWAAPELVSLSPDTTIDLVPRGRNLLTDQDLAVDNLLGLVVEESLGNSVAARDGVALVGYHDEGSGDRLLVFDEPIQLFGTVPAPGDIVRFNGASYDVIFDATAQGIPASVEVDALTRGVDGELVLSFDTHVDLGRFTAADEDLVRFDGRGFTHVFDASTLGVPAYLDLDAASYDSQGMLFVSFDTAGEIAGVAFSDEDILEFDPFTQTWARQLAFDASADASGNAASWLAADLQAIHVPEPGFGLALATSAFLLAGLARRPRLAGHADGRPLA